MARRAFYSFHYKPDNWRAAQVRNIGSIEGNRPTTDNDWETIKKAGEGAIKKWIADQMTSRSCTVVLVGTNTANRKWINHEIIQSWNDRMGVVGIHVYGLKDQDGCTSSKGDNPFHYISLGNPSTRLSSIVKCYDPKGHSSRERYDWILQNLAGAVEEAIDIRIKSKDLRFS
ncbi:MAG: TIR-like PF08937 domain protein [Candidatus Synechococcus spongiarum 15L]|uniref:TIR-like PF08937 domain protein n=1 Tax=Candidatus Synechococcus spongiarum 15L TaxID=1608419 RepID=A0A0G8ATR4_9SYNE|nr:MAG: TIR-like PF08937 domain protein [Candidatus Synechococcus spongiarum 15L]